MRKKKKILRQIAACVLALLVLCPVFPGTDSRSLPARAAEKKVTVERSDNPYYYADYGFGTMFTYKYKVTFGGVSATAYCIQPSKYPPESGSYDVTKLSDGKNLAKVCYYGTKASGDDSFFSEDSEYGNLSAGARFILVHLAASYASGGDDAFSGANEKGKKLAVKLYEYCVSQPEIPDVEMSFSADELDAYADGNGQRTKTVTFRADEQQSVTLKLPDGVRLHNVTTGKTSVSGADVTISGGTEFYLSAPLNQAERVGTVWSSRMKGSVTKDFSAYKINAEGKQDLALVFGEGVEDEKYVNLKVRWLQMGEITVKKVDAQSGSYTPQGDASLAGAVYGLYAEKDIIHPDGHTGVLYKAGTLIAQETFGAEDHITFSGLYPGSYAVKELTAPKGYRKDETSYPVTLTYDASEAAVVKRSVTVKETVIKQAFQILKISSTGNEETEQLVSGAQFTVKLLSEVKKAGWDAAAVYDVLTTDHNGYAKSKELPYGVYQVRETKVPAGLNPVSDFTVTISQDSREPQGWIVLNDVPEQSYVRLVKKDAVTGTVVQMAGTEFKIRDVLTGKYVTQKVGGQRIDTFVTGEDGTVTTPLMLPAGDYEAVEIKAPKGYVCNPSPVAFSVGRPAIRRTDQDADPENIPLIEVVIEDQPITVTVTKKDITGEEEVPGAQLEILDASGEVIDEWQSQQEPHVIYGIPAGSYILREVCAPSGYVIASDVPFQVSETGEVQTVEMRNDTAKGKICIQKTEEKTGKPLEGVVYELRDSTGQLLETLITDAEGKAESGLYEIAEYEAGVMGNAKEYWLTETRTLEGYELDQTVRKVVFAYEDGNTPVILEELHLTNQKIPESNEEEKKTKKDQRKERKKQQKNEQRKEQNKKETEVKKAPKTGDVPVMPFCVLIPTAGVGILSAAFFGKVRRHS